MLEDRFSTQHGNIDADIDKARPTCAYLRDNYFNNPEYIRHGAGDDPLRRRLWTDHVSTAVPNGRKSWPRRARTSTFCTLWYESDDAGANADGEYAWIYEDESADNHLDASVEHSCNSRAPTLGTAGGVAYPGFNDYYQEGGVGNVVPFEIPHDNGQTLDAVLDQFEPTRPRTRRDIDFLQLATFNDFGEGTMFEPTVETGFEY